MCCVPMKKKGSGMNQWLLMLACLMAMSVGPSQATTKEVTHHGKSIKSKKSDVSKTGSKKPTKASTKHTQSSHPHKKEAAKSTTKSHKAVPKKSTKAEHTSAKTHAPKTSHASVATERKPAHHPMIEEKDEPVGKTKEGKTVFEGSRHGHYYVDDKHNKVYVENFVGAKIVGRTHDGRPIYEGPRGGHFYYTASGNKEYVQH